MIYTRTGDNGTTHLIGPTRVSKASPRVEAYGTVDELNAWIGWVIAQDPESPWVGRLKTVQSDLFVIGSYLALDPSLTEIPPNFPPLPESRVGEMESWIDEWLNVCPPMRSFILPGGHPVSATLHIARTVCRRAERLITRLHEQETIPPAILKYLNRLSDVLFALARYVNHHYGIQDIKWQPHTST